MSDGGHALPFKIGETKQLLIDGKFVPASTGETFVSTNPSTGETVARFAQASAEDVNAAVAAARRAFEGPWSKFKPSERQAVLLKLADLVERDFETLATMDVLEMGRPISAALAGKSMVTRLIRHFAGAATAIHGETPGNSFPVELFSYTVKEPIGVVGVIIPWNGPTFSACWKTAPALATGCTVVLKPSEEASLSSIRFGELCLEAGVPPGVVNIVTGGGATGAAIASHPDVDKITFTGSCETGQRIIEASARTIKRVTLELGGKSPNIVFADADLDIAVPGSALGIFSNSGQICSAGSRIYVERKIHDEFVARLAEYGKTMRIGASIERETQIGPLVSEKQLGKVCSYLDLGPREGAQLVAGGERLSSGALAKGFFVPPTVFAGVGDSMRIAREEIFGPVACVFPFDSFDEVIQRANDTNFGLAAGVWTRDITRAHAAIKRLRAGSVWVNHYQAMDPQMPFGGYKMSGFGREGGTEHIASYLNTKGVWIRTVMN